MAKRERYVTAKGVAVYPWLNKPMTKFDADGTYKCNLKLTGQDAAELKAKVDEAVEAALAEAKKKAKGKKVKEGEVPYIEYEDGSIEFKFKIKAKGSNGNETWDNKVVLFDAKGTKVDANVYGGSEVKVAYNIIPYSTGLAGTSVSLRLLAVQVIKLVSGGGGNADAFGFGEEEGFEGEEAAPTTGSEAGFSDETGGAGEEEAPPF